MAGLIIEKGPASYPVSLTLAKNFLRVTNTDDDALINVLIAAANEQAEMFCKRSFALKNYIQTLDSFPYYTDSVQSQMAYPPSYYALPMYSTTLWNYSQMIKLYAPPLVSVNRISFLSSGDEQWHDMLPTPPIWYPGVPVSVGTVVMDTNGNQQKCVLAGTTNAIPPSAQNINGSVSPYLWNAEIGGITTEDNPDPDSEGTGVQWQNIGPLPSIGDLNDNKQFGLFVADCINEPGRIFPTFGQMWPPVLYVPNAVQIHYTAGYSTPQANSTSGIFAPVPQIPNRATMAMLQLIANWYENREAAATGNFGDIPNHVKSLLWSCRVMDMQPTRG